MEKETNQGGFDDGRRRGGRR